MSHGYELEDVPFEDFKHGFSIQILLRTLMPLLILQTSSPPGMTEAVVTSAPKRVRVSVMHVVSISSDPSAMGTSTRFDILRADVWKNARLVDCGEDRKACDPLPNARNAATTIRMAKAMLFVLGRDFPFYATPRVRRFSNQHDVVDVHARRSEHQIERWL